MKSFLCMIITLFVALESFSQNFNSPEYFPDPELLSQIQEDFFGPQTHLPITRQMLERKESLFLAGGRIETLKGLELLDNLTMLDFEGVVIEMVDLSPNSNVSELNIRNSTITVLHLSTNDRLKGLGITRSSVDEMFLPENSSLTEFSGYLSNYPEVDFTKHPKMGYVDLFGSNPLVLDFTQCPELEALWIDEHPIETLDLSQNPLLIELLVFGCGLREIIMNPLSLETIRIHDNNLSAIDFSGASNLDFVDLQFNDFTSTDQVTGIDSLRGVRFFTITNNNLDCSSWDAISSLAESFDHHGAFNPDTERGETSFVYSPQRGIDEFNCTSITEWVYHQH